MNITKVKVFPVEGERLKAYANIVVDDCFIIRDLKIINGNSGVFVAMPSKKCKDGTYRDTAHPLDNETRKKIEDAVWAEYDEALKKLQPGFTGNGGRVALPEYLTTPDKPSQ